jgi:hypothetical protein
LPRLLDREVLVKAVQDGVGRLDAPFAYATGKSEEGHHTGLVFRELGTIYLDEKSLLVHPDHVVRPPEVEPIPTGKEDEEPGEGEKEPGEEPTPPEKKVTRYYGRVVIDPQRANKDMALIVEEVVERLTSQIGCEVEITVEINADRPEGFDEGTVRTISENSNTLKFEHFGFEEE